MPAGTILSGSVATVKYGGTPSEVLHATGWTLSATVKNRSFATNSSSGWDLTVAGTKTYTSTITVALHDGEASPLGLGESVAIQYHIDDTGSNYYSGTGRVIGLGDIEANIDEGTDMLHTYQIACNGVLTANGTVPPLS